MALKLNPVTGNFDLVASPGGGTAVTDFATDSGTATPDVSGIITLSGGSSLTTVGAVSTVTISIDGTILVADGGTQRSSLTDGAILVGDGTNPVELIGPLTDGQLLIGSTSGVSPVAASLTGGTGITITPGAGTITISASAGTGDVMGPASSTDNAVARFDGITGKLIQNSTVTISDTGTVAASELTLTTDLAVAHGGSGASTLTDGGILLGSGASAITATAQPASGQMLIGSVGADPVLGTITGGAHLLVTPGVGTLDIDLTSNVDTTAIHGWNGSVLESPAVTVASDGATITLSIEKSGGGDLTLVFSDEFTAFDTSPAATLALTAGTDTVPVLNYIYIPQSSKVLTKSTISFPSAEHIPIATVLCESAATFQTDTAYKVHAWTDHVIDTSEQGHISHLNAWIRKQNATWISGVGQTFTITPNGGAADNVILTTASGVALQLHNHIFPAFSGTPDVYVVNDSGSAYTKVTDLNALLTDSTGASMSGKYFSLVIWGCVSEVEADCKLFCNLPSGSYNNATSLIADSSRFANFTIPADFKGTGFLIAEWELQHQSSMSGTWTSIDEIDLRGFIPNTVAGGATASTSEFIDSSFRILDDGDNTKEIAFQASGITTATTRTMTVPNADGTIAYASGLATQGFAYALDGNTIDSTAAATNGQLLIGSTGVVPVAASLTQPAAGLTITGGAGSVTFALANGLAALEALASTGMVAHTGADTYTERTITGTAARISMTNGNGVAGNPTIDIDATYVGQASITTLGTVATGTWEATDVGVLHGGSGRSTGGVAYSVICAGTTATGAQQNVAALGASGTVLTSNGASALPSFQTNAAGSGGAWDWVSTTVISDDAIIEFKDLTATNYKVILSRIVFANNAETLFIQVSDDNGSTYAASNYQNSSNQNVIGTLTGKGSGTEAGVNLNEETIGNGSGEHGYNGVIKLFNFSQASYPMSCTFNVSFQNTSGELVSLTGCAISSDDLDGGDTKDVDAFKFTTASGNITSGLLHLYIQVTS